MGRFLFPPSNPDCNSHANSSDTHTHGYTYACTHGYTSAYSYPRARQNPTEEPEATMACYQKPNCVFGLYFSLYSTRRNGRTVSRSTRGARSRGHGVDVAGRHDGSQTPSQLDRHIYTEHQDTISVKVFTSLYDAVENDTLLDWESPADTVIEALTTPR
jgi:hypothetical protein